MAGFLKSLLGGSTREPGPQWQAGFTIYPPPGSDQPFSTRIEPNGRGWTIHPPPGSFPGYSTAVEPDD